MYGDVGGDDHGEEREADGLEGEAGGDDRTAAERGRRGYPAIGATSIGMPVQGSIRSPASVGE